MKNKKMNIWITDEQFNVLRVLGGYTAGFETIYEFYLKNIGTSKTKSDKARETNLKMITEGKE